MLYAHCITFMFIIQMMPPEYLICVGCNQKSCGPGSSVGIATDYGLDSPGIESQWGARLSTPVHTGPGSHLASCTLDAGSFLGVKSGQGVRLTPHPLLVPRSRKSRAVLLLPLWAVQPVQSLSACKRCTVTLLGNRRGTFQNTLISVCRVFTASGACCIDVKNPRIFTKQLICKFDIIQGKKR